MKGDRDLFNNNGLWKGAARTSRREDYRRSADDRRGRSLVLCGAALPLLLLFYVVFLLSVASPPSSGEQLRLDQFLTAVAKGHVEGATILAGADRIVGTADTGPYWVDFPGGHESLFASLMGALEQARVPTTMQREPLQSLVAPANVILPLLILGDAFVIVSVLLRKRGALGDFGQAGARRVAAGEGTVTFAQLAGVDEAVEELSEIRDYLANPKRFAAMGAAVPKGILLSGPPGCGKTRLARAVAGESNAAFFSISGSDFVEMYVGVGAARIRDLFATAARQAPAIVFIDELDAVGRRRTDSPAGGQDEREATLNQLLVEMDGFDEGTGVVVLGATNRPDVLDPALLRPGRLDRRVTIDLPDVRGREGILRLHAQGKPIAESVDMAGVARSTPGFSGADLASVVNEAALLAMRGGSAIIEPAVVSEAVERVVAGPQRRSRIISPAERERIAYHEAGHAICAAALPGVDRVAKVSIVARGHGGGFTWYVPDGDQVLATRTQLSDRICALLGGQAAEELVFGEPSTGSADDLGRAAAIARRMVTELGMSARIGPLSLVQVAATGVERAGSSERIAAEMDREVQRLLREGLERAAGLLRAHPGVLADLAGQLIAAESLEGEPLDRMLDTVSAARRPLAARMPELVAAYSTPAAR